MSKPILTDVKNFGTPRTEESLSKETANTVYGTGVDEMLTNTESLGNVKPSGTEYLKMIDGRTWRAKKIKDAMIAMQTDLGGESTLSFIEVEILRRFACLSVLAEEVEYNIAIGQDIDLDQYIMIGRAMQMLGKTVGTKRVAVPINDKPNLSTYLKNKDSFQKRNG